MAARPFPDPKSNRSASTVAQFLEGKARCAGPIHEHCHLRPLDDDTSVKSLIADWRGNHGLLVFLRMLGSQPLPGPNRMRDILHGVPMANRVRCAKIEGPEVHHIVRLRIGHPKRDTKKTPLNRLTSSEHVNLDRAIGKVVTLKPPS